MRSAILKGLLGIFLVIIVVLCTVVWFSLNQVNELQNQNRALQEQNGALQDQNRELQDKNKELQDQNSYLQSNAIPTKIKISNFSTNGVDSWGGVSWSTKFIVKIENNETKNVDGVTLTFNILSSYNIKREIIFFGSNGVYVGEIKVGESYAVGILKQGETKEINGEIENNFADDAKLSGSHFIATLKLGDIILDEAIINF